MPTLVTLTRDMRPYRKDDDAALPDDLAQKLIDAGDARLSNNHASSGLQPDKAKPEPPARNRFIPRGRR